VPIWDVTKEALTTYWLTPVVTVEGSSMAAYDPAWIAPRLHRADNFLSMDLTNMGHVVEKTQHSIDAGLRCSLSYSVHATTLQDREKRRAFLGALYETPARLRPYLHGLIAEIEIGTPASAVSEWVQMLRPVTSEVTVQLHEGDTLLDTIGETGAAVACFTLPAGQGDADIRRQCGRRIQRWAAMLRRQRVAFRVDNVRDLDLLSLTIAAGAEHLTSELFWPSVSKPGGVTRFPRSQLQPAARRRSGEA
jgi:hypothetical protein